jgi:FMN reductase
MSTCIVGIGGTTRENSTSERALRLALDAVATLGARTEAFCAHDLDLPMYAPGAVRSPRADRFVEAVRHADGIIIASPGYHGGVSGLVKNAIDWVEELREDPRPYFDGRAVGLIVCAQGWQATTTTLTSLRSIVHALRGWPTPLGVAINSADPIFDPAGNPQQPLQTQLEILAAQIVDHARRYAAARRVPGAVPPMAAVSARVAASSGSA